jgi:hypothetical protein
MATAALLLLSVVFVVTSGLHTAPTLASGLPAGRLAAVSRRSAVRCAADGDSTAGRGFGAASKKKGRAPKAGKPAKRSTPIAPVTAGGDMQEAEERGRRALEAMRLESGSQPANPFKRSGPALTEEEASPIDPSAGVMPEAVSQRILNRVVQFAALPVVGGGLVFVGFFYANTALDLDLPPQIVAYATQACLLLSFAGITYGVMSTSWDEVEPRPLRARRPRLPLTACALALPHTE